MAIFFIIGRGRSGTWLLRSVLNQHSKVFVPNEGMFILNLYQRFKDVHPFTKKDAEQFYKALWTEKRLITWWRVDKEPFLQALLDEAAKGNADFSKMCYAVFKETARQSGKIGELLIGDKNPTYTFFLKEMERLYPDAKFILMVRDPRANVLSFQKVGFDLNHTAALAFRWKSYTKAILKFRKKYPGKTLMLSYEEFVEMPDSVLEKIADFLNIETEDRMLEYYKADHMIFSGNVNIKKPISASKATAWKKEIGHQDAALIERICRKEMEGLGYEPLGYPMRGQQYFSLVWGSILGGTSNFLERLIFKIPLILRTLILSIYRFRYGTLTLKEALGIKKST